MKSWHAEYELLNAGSVATCIGFIETQTLFPLLDLLLLIPSSWMWILDFKLSLSVDYHSNGTKSNKKGGQWSEKVTTVIRIYIPWGQYHIHPTSSQQHKGVERNGVRLQRILVCQGIASACFIGSAPWAPVFPERFTRQCGCQLSLRSMQIHRLRFSPRKRV